MKNTVLALLLVISPLYSFAGKTVPVTINSVTIIGSVPATVTAIGTGFFACNPAAPAAVFNGTGLTWQSSNPTQSSVTYLLPLSLMSAGGTYSLTITNCTGGTATFDIGYSVADPSIAHTNAANVFSADQTVQGNLAANSIYGNWIQSQGGVMGLNSSTATFSSGVFGYSTANTGLNMGVLGVSQSTSDAAAGVVGSNTAQTGTTHGIRGIVESGQGTAGFFLTRSTGNVIDGFAYTGPSSNPTSFTEAFRVDGSGSVYAQSYNQLSDRNAKENLKVVDGAQLLVALAALPISSWNYRNQMSSVRHIGPMAQDFRTAFGLGEDNKHIAVIDSEGVALAAIQQLYRMDLEKDAQITQLTEEVKQLRELREEVAFLQAVLKSLYPRKMEAVSPGCKSQTSSALSAQ